MPELTNVDLKFNLEGVGGDAATQLLTSLADLATKVSAALADIGKSSDLADFEEQASAISDSLTVANDELVAMVPNADKAQASISSASDAASTLAEKLSAAATTALTDPYQAWADQLTTAATESGDLAVNAKDAVTNSQEDNFAKWATSLSSAAGDAGKLSDSTGTMETDAKTNPFESWATSMSDIASSTATTYSLMGDIAKSGQTSPFEPWVKASATIQANMDGAYSAMLKMSETKVPSMQGGGSGSGSRSSGATKTSVPKIPENYGTWFTGLNANALPSELQSSYQKYMDEYVGWGQATTNEKAPEHFFNEYQQYMKQNSDGQLKPGTSHSKGLHLNTGHIMNAAMNGMMGYYGLQMLAQGASNFGYIQQIMQEGMGMSNGNYGQGAVNEAAQAYAMLSSAGMSGSSGADFLTGLQKSLTGMFTQTNGSPLPQSALLLEQYGVNKGIITTSPWEALQGIQKAYMGLMNTGRANDAATLLGDTGTAQLATAFENWSSLKQDTSGINLGMNSTNLADATKQGLGLNANLSKLGIAFDQFALAAVPAMTKVTKALTDLANVFSGKESIGQGLENISKDLGPFGTAIVTAGLALKGFNTYMKLHGFLSGGSGSGEERGGVLPAGGKPGVGSGPSSGGGKTFTFGIGDSVLIDVPTDNQMQNDKRSMIEGLYKQHKITKAQYAQDMKGLDHRELLFVRNVSECREVVSKYGTSRAAGVEFFFDSHAQMGSKYCWNHFPRLESVVERVANVGQAYA